MRVSSRPSVYLLCLKHAPVCRGQRSARLTVLVVRAQHAYQFAAVAQDHNDFLCGSRGSVAVVPPELRTGDAMSCHAQQCSTRYSALRADGQH